MTQLEYFQVVGLNLILKYIQETLLRLPYSYNAFISITGSFSNRISFKLDNSISIRFLKRQSIYTLLLCPLLYLIKYWQKNSTSRQDHRQ